MDLISQIVVHGFLVGMLLIGVLHARRSTLDSYTSETNRVSVPALVATLVGTSFGGGVIVGMVTMGFEAGVVGVIVGASYFIGFVVLAVLAGKIRDALSNTNGSLLDYLGKKHADRETGGLQHDENAEEARFLSTELDATKRQVAMDIATEACDLMKARWDEFYGWVKGS